MRRKESCKTTCFRRASGKDSRFVSERPSKSTRPARRQLDIPQTTVWCALKRRLYMKPYKRSLVQAYTDNDQVMRRTFCESMVEDDETPFFTSNY